MPIPAFKLHIDDSNDREFLDALKCKDIYIDACYMPEDEGHTNRCYYFYNYNMVEFRIITKDDRAVVIAADMPGEKYPVTAMNPRQLFEYIECPQNYDDRRGFKRIRDSHLNISITRKVFRSNEARNRWIIQQIDKMIEQSRNVFDYYNPPRLHV